MNTMSNPNASCFRVALSRVTLGFDNKFILSQIFWHDFFKPKFFVPKIYFGQTMGKNGKREKITNCFRIFYFV